MSISFNLNTLQEYLDINNIQESDKRAILDIFSSVDTTNDYGEDIKDGRLTRDEVPNFFEKIMSNPNLSKIVGPFLRGLTPQQSNIPQKLTPEELAADREELAKKIINTFDKAKEELIQKIKGKNLKFPHPITKEAISAEDLLESLNKITYEASGYGSAEALKDRMGIQVNITPSDGKNPPPLSSQWNRTVEESMKILLHEALHNDYKKRGADPGFNTQEEELYVEKNAILLLSQITENDKIMIYNQKLSDLANDNELLETVLQADFINKGYANRPKDSTGAVNILGNELTPEDEVYINNVLRGNIGAPPNGCLFDQLHEKDIRVGGKLGGKVLLSPVKNSLPLEVRDVDGNIKFKAYFLPNNDFGI